MAGADEAGDTVSQVAEQTPGKPEQTPGGQTPGGQTPGGPGHTPEEPEQTPPKPEQATEAVAEQTPQAPGFGERGRMRRRARFLRKSRELAYRDLGGLVFDLHRFGQRNDPLVLAKLAALRHIDTELRTLEQALGDRRPVTVLREAGIAACPRCAAIHDSDDRFCPGCGLAFDANADRPIATGPIPPQQIPAPAPAAAAAPQPSAPPAQIPAPASPSSAPAAQIPPASPSSAPAAQIPPASPSSAPATQISPPAPAQISALSQPKVEQAPSVKPKVERTPSVKPTAPPVAAKPTSPPVSPEQREPDRAEEDEPTQILRPPATGT